MSNKLLPYHITNIQSLSVQQLCVTVPPPGVLLGVEAGVVAGVVVGGLTFSCVPLPCGCGLCRSFSFMTSHHQESNEPNLNTTKYIQLSCNRVALPMCCRCERTTKFSTLNHAESLPINAIDSN